MKITKIEIENLGHFKNHSTIELGGKISSIIGENGTGKSTILFLIMFFLDPKTRKRGINENLINDTNTPFMVRMVFNLSEDEGNKTHLNALPIVEDEKIVMEISGEKNDEVETIEPTIKIGEIEQIEFNIFQKLPFDDYIDLIYVNSQYENYDEALINKEFENGDNNGNELFSQIIDEINLTNKQIGKIDRIKNFTEVVNKETKDIFNNNDFGVSLLSNIETKKIGKTLKFFPNKNLKVVSSHGDGFNKIFSIMAKIKSNLVDGKDSIIIIDELENHLFHSYQKQVINYLIKINSSQLIVVTHSPNLVTLLPDSSITKLKLNEESSTFLINPARQFYYWQVELFSAVFYENILMVEGHAEKIFFEYLFKFNDAVRDMISGKSIFIMCIQGTDFRDKINLLKNLLKKIIILTDNDMWVPAGKNENQLMGIKRIFELIKIYNEDYDIGDVCFDEKADNIKIQKIIQEGEERYIYTQENHGESFEDSLFNEQIVNENERDNLKRSKLKNLSPMLEDICSKVTKTTIDNSKYLLKWLSVL